MKFQKKIMKKNQVAADSSFLQLQQGKRLSNNNNHLITSSHSFSFLPFLGPELKRVRGIAGKYNKRDKYDKDENERLTHSQHAFAVT